MYETKTSKPATTENLASLVDWARKSGVVDGSWGFDDAALDEIRDARNYFGHASRVIAPKTRKKVVAGTFKLLLPGKQVSRLGDLDTREFAHNTIRYTASILKRLI